LVELPNKLEKVIDIGFGFEELFGSQTVELWKNLEDFWKVQIRFIDRQGIEIKIPLVDKTEEILYRVLRFEKQGNNQMKIEALVIEKWRDIRECGSFEEFDCTINFGKEEWVIESGTSFELISDIVAFYHNWDIVVPMDCKNRDWIEEGISKMISPRFLIRPFPVKKWHLEMRRANEENQWLKRRIREDKGRIKI
jgi:hypothetical protein